MTAPPNSLRALHLRILACLALIFTCPSQPATYAQATTAQPYEALIGDAIKSARAFDYVQAGRQEAAAELDRINKLGLETQLSDILVPMLTNPRVDSFAKLKLLNNLRPKLVVPSDHPGIQAYIPGLIWQLTNRKWGDAYSENFVCAAITLHANDARNRPAVAKLIDNAFSSPDLPWEEKLRILNAFDSEHSSLGLPVCAKNKPYLEFSQGNIPFDDFQDSAPPLWLTVYALQKRIFTSDAKSTTQVIRFLENKPGRDVWPSLHSTMSQGTLPSKEAFDQWLTLAIRAEPNIADPVWSVLERSARTLRITNRDAINKQLIAYLKSDKDKKGEMSISVLAILHRLGPLNQSDGREVEAMLADNHPLYAGKNSLYVPIIKIGLLQALQYHPMNRSSWKYIHEAFKTGDHRYVGNVPLILLATQPPECKADFKPEMVALLNIPQASSFTVSDTRQNPAAKSLQSWIAIEVLLTAKDFSLSAQEIHQIKLLRSDQMPQDLLNRIDQLK